MSVPTRDEMLEQIQRIRALIQPIVDNTDNPAVEHALLHADEQLHYALTQLAAGDLLMPELERLR